MKKDIYVLGIESSCDETSVAVVKNGREVLSNVINSQIKIHENYGGVVPEIASRCHTEVINQVMKQALKEANMKLEDILNLENLYSVCKCNIQKKVTLFELLELISSINL